MSDSGSRCSTPLSLVGPCGAPELTACSQTSQFAGVAWLLACMALPTCMRVLLHVGPIANMLSVAVSSQLHCHAGLASRHVGQRCTACMVHCTALSACMELCMAGEFHPLGSMHA